MNNLRTTLASLIAVLAFGILFATPAFAQSTPELCYDGIDNDSNPATLDDVEPPCIKVDGDADGYAKFVKSGGTDVADCDDTNPAIHPNAPEVPGNDVDENCDGINAPAPAAAATVTATGATVSGTCPAGQSCQPDASAKEALAERWGATYDEANDTITCVVPDSNPAGAGENCWSKDFEVGNGWNWNVDPTLTDIDKAEHAPAPYRWSKTSGVFVQKATFVAIDRTHGITEMEEQLKAIEAELATKASSTEVAAVSDRVSQFRSDFDAYVVTNNGELDTFRTRLDDLTGLLGRVTALETDVTDLKRRVTDLEESDEKQNRALAYLLRNARIYFDASVGYVLMAGEAVVTTVDDEEFAFRNGLVHLVEIGGTVGLQNNNNGHGVQLTYGFGWGSDTGGVGINHNLLVGPMFRATNGVSLGVRGGLNVNQAGVRDGSNLSSSTGGVIAFSGMATPPLDALPGVRWDVGATIDSVRYDDLDNSHRKTVPRFFARLSGRWGTTVKASPIDASEFED